MFDHVIDILLNCVLEDTIPTGTPDIPVNDICALLLTSVGLPVISTNAIDPAPPADTGAQSVLEGPVFIYTDVAGLPSERKYKLPAAACPPAGSPCPLIIDCFVVLSTKILEKLPIIYLYYSSVDESQLIKGLFGDVVNPDLTALNLAVPYLGGDVGFGADKIVVDSVPSGLNDPTSIL